MSHNKVRWIVIAVAVATALMGQPLFSAGLLLGFEVGNVPQKEDRRAEAAEARAEALTKLLDHARDCIKGEFGPTQLVQEIDQALAAGEAQHVQTES